MYFCSNQQFYYALNTSQYIIPQFFQNDIMFLPNYQSKTQNVNEFLQSKITENEQSSKIKQIVEEKHQNPQNKNLLLHQDSDYEPINHNNIVLYKKKNTQSNISNQIYSFVSSVKSFEILMKLLDQSKDKVEEFYKLVKRIKKVNKKYMNRAYIINLIKLEENSTNFKIYKRSKCSIQIQKLRKSLRILVLYFIKNVCDISLLTSKKMNKEILGQHLIRKRQIQYYLIQQLK